MPAGSRLDQIRVTRDITYGQILKGDVRHAQVLKAQVNEWLLGPVKHLVALRHADRADIDHGIALLSLIILFFEYYGQYLPGRESKSASR